MDSEYIKMVLALPDEFFEGWEWRHCDYAINLDNIEKGRATPLEEQFHTEFKILYVDSCFKDTEWVFKDRVRPIPSQEQLQKMVGLSPNEFIEDLSDYTCEPVKEAEDLSIFHDMNCFTLAYVMDRKYGKYWNGDAWI